MGRNGTYELSLPLVLLISILDKLCRLLEFGVHQLLLEFLVLEHFVNVLREKQSGAHNSGVQGRPHEQPCSSLLPHLPVPHCTFLCLHTISSTPGAPGPNPSAGPIQKRPSNRQICISYILKNCLFKKHHSSSRVPHPWPCPQPLQVPCCLLNTSLQKNARDPAQDVQGENCTKQPVPSTPLLSVSVPGSICPGPPGEVACSKGRSLASDWRWTKPLFLGQGGE